jgi:phosphatidate cytidylyltransferase
MMAAFIGDLLASAVKRSAEVTTFGNILPGHGGILDRFDSLMMAGAFTFLFAQLQQFIL